MAIGDEPPKTIVFDAEPLIAYFCDEPRSDTVEAYIDAVMTTSDGYISAVNLAEIHYVVRDIEDVERADTVVDIIEETGIRRVDIGETWRTAAEFKFRYSPALGDAFAIATAEDTNGILLTGTDDDYDGITDVPIIRFRTEPT